MNLLDQFFSHFPGPFENRRLDTDILKFDVVCKRTNTPVLRVDASQYVDANEARVTAAMITEFFNLNHPIDF